MGEIINAVSDFVKDYGGLGWVIAAAALAFTVFQFLYKRRTGGVKLDVTFSNGVLTYPNGDGWFLLRLSVHDPIMPLNVESDSKGGVKIICDKLGEFLKTTTGLDL